MNQIKLEVEFEAPLEKVWAILADTATTPEWVHGVKQSIVTDEGVARKSFCWEEKVSIDGQNADVSHEFVEWEPMKHAAIKTELPMGGWMRKVFNFSENAGKVKMEIEMTWNLGILEMLAGPAKVHVALEKSLLKTLENWKVRALS
ncbi:MAG TPA: SRPBCC family protein [Candidatus Omnitrophota bacterium]|nr:SRPBCC family protein [Candidatus Omnitrophota bacterium]